MRGANPVQTLIHAGPSIQNQDRLRQALEEIGLPSDVSVDWNPAGQLTVSRHGAKYRIEADTFEEAFELLGELVVTCEIDLGQRRFQR